LYLLIVNALGPMGQYSVLIFCIPTVFDIIPLELVRFRNFWYSVSSCSFSCPALPLSFSFSYSNVEVENGWEVFRPFSSLHVGSLRPTTWCWQWDMPIWLILRYNYKYICIYYCSAIVIYLECLDPLLLSYILLLSIFKTAAMIWNKIKLLLWSAAMTLL